MKTKLLIFFIFCIAFAFAQTTETKNAAQGHWFFCHPEFGYSEFYIQDSTIEWGNVIIGGFTGRPVKEFVEVENFFLRADVSDTFYFKVMDENTVMSSLAGEEILMTRMPDSVLNLGDFNCDLKLSVREFSQVIEAEFLVRHIKNKRYCPPLMEFSSETSPFVEEDKKNNTEPSAAMAFIEPQIISKKAPENQAPKLIYLLWSSDSSEVKICVELAENCYADFQEKMCQIDKNGKLELNYGKLEGGCENLCQMRLYFQLMVRNTTSIERILLNGVLVEGL